MKKSYLLLISVIVGIFVVSLVNAVPPSSVCGVLVASTNTQSFLNEIPSVDSKLQTCTILIDGSINSLVGNGDVLVEVTMNSGSVENFYITIANKQITHITAGTTNSKYTVMTSEATMDKILSSNDVLNDILDAYNNKEIKVVAHGFFNKIKFFFAKFFIPKASNNNQNNAVTGKPEYCDETYLPGHRNYAENKELWDSYSADTDNVCQSQYGKGIPSPCVHSVQLSIEGNPYYLCWYNN